MSLTMIPHVGCNAGCTGCYEGAIFNRTGKAPAYDVDAMLAAAAARRDHEGRPERGDAVMHGGEVSLVPAADMRRIVVGLLESGRKHVTFQTNGLTLTRAQIDLFAEFNFPKGHPRYPDGASFVDVGVSLNGPRELNRDRRFGTVEQTDRATDRIHRNVREMLGRGIPVGIIVVLSRTNAGDAGKVDRLIEWADEMQAAGVSGFRFNPLGYHAAADVVTGEESTCLTEEELSYAWVRLARHAMGDPSRSWMPFREFMDNLWGLGVQPCWTSGCDPYNTEAVYGVMPDGSLGNCMRTASVDGIAYTRDGQTDTLRSDTLRQVPYPDGGCGGCRWFPVCHGGCPGEAVGGDWRNRSMFCGAYIAVFEFLERGLKGWLPNFTARPDWRAPDGNEAALQDAINRRNPPFSPLMTTFPAWSAEPSTWTNRSRSPRRPQ